MNVIRFLSRRRRSVGVVHPTTPRVGIFAVAQRLRSTGPQAHQHTYVADEERATNEKVLIALARVAGILIGGAVGLSLGRVVFHAARAGWHFLQGLPL